MPSKALMRIEVESNKAEREIRQFQRELDKLKGNMSELTQAAGLNVAALTKMGGALALVQGASKVVKDAFSQMETRADAFERTIAGVKAGYETFLSTLNGGNWSNFFQNLSTAVQGARDLADAFDRLDSIKGNNAPAIAGLQETIQQLRTRQDAGEDVTAQMKAAVNQLQKLQQQSVTQGKNTGRDAIIQAVTNGYQSMQGAGVLAKSSAEKFADEYLKGGQAVMDKYAKMYKDLERRGTKMTTTWQNIGTSTAGIAITQEVTEPRFSPDNLSKQDLINYNFAKAITQYEEEIRKGGAVWTAASQEGRGMYREQHKGNAYTLKGASGGSGKTKKEEVVYAEGSIGAQEKKIKDLTDAWRKVADDDSRAKLKKQIEEANTELDRMMGKTKEVEMTRGTSGFNAENISNWTSMMEEQLEKADFGTPIYNSIKENLKDMSSLTTIMQEAMKRGLDVKSLGLEGVFEGIFNGENIDDSTFQALVDKLNTVIKEGLDPLEFDIDTGGLKKVESEVKKIQKAASTTATVAGSIGDAFNAIEDPAAKVMGTVAQAIASVALGYGNAVAQAASMGPWAWIAFAVTGLATMITSISAIKSATAGSYAEGGIIPGNSFTGDKVPINVNSGELILNRAQQSNLASQLQDNGVNSGAGNNRPSYSYVRGEDICVALNNYLRRTRRGELVTWR